MMFRGKADINNRLKKSSSTSLDDCSSIYDDYCAFSDRDVDVDASIRHIVEDD